uniref:Uncharacterized protein n=1 Tax=Erpetoichthys calabaricus TaxID=27687 RepID=A0A8C4X6C4_ERPCA
MCLVCIAFASWAMRSANLQSPDMWKTGNNLRFIGLHSCIRVFPLFM